MDLLYVKYSSVNNIEYHKISFTHTTKINSTGNFHRAQLEQNILSKAAKSSIFSAVKAANQQRYSRSPGSLLTKLF